MKVAVIGAGVIGSAIAKALVQSHPATRIIASDKLSQRLKDLKKIGVVVTTENRRAASEADIMFLCVKPSDVETVLKEVREEVKGKLVISVAAGVGLDFLKRVAPEARFVRAMPNLGILVQGSFTCYCPSENVSEEDKKVANSMLCVLGRAVEVDEKYMDAVTALSGCSPAYLSFILEAMVSAGEEIGLPKELALVSLAQTMIGTGRLILEAGKDPAQIISMVATPGGVTEEGLKVLARYPIRKAISETMKAGVAKAKEISQSLR